LPLKFSLRLSAFAVKSFFASLRRCGKDIYRGLCVFFACLARNMAVFLISVYLCLPRGIAEQDATWGESLAEF
jgi:hypothetical protein